MVLVAAARGTMSSGEDQASRWARLFRSSTIDAAESELRSGDWPDDSTATGRLAWRAHRAALARAEARVDAKARDLEMLQALGRVLADALTLDELLDRAAERLATLLEADAVAIASLIDETPGARIYLRRPLAADDRARLTEIVALGFVPISSEIFAARHLAEFDPLQGPRERLVEDDVVVVPIARRGRETLRLGVVSRTGATDRGSRIVSGAASHLALHLDRVLAVAESEQGRFRAILDSMPHAVVLTDLSFRIAHANRAAEALAPRLGGDPDAALRSIGDLDLASLAYDVLAGRRAETSGEARLDASALEVTVAPWRDRSGRVDGLVVVILDVTTARRLQDQIAQSEKLSSLGRMIAGVVHELNNPLAAVIGYAQLLRTMPPGDKTLARLDVVRKEAERCRKIVQNLLRFARPAGADRRAISLNEIAENVASLLAYPIRSAGCRIVLDLAGDLPAVVGDAHALEQALVNLVTNAQQAMAGAGVGGRIRIGTSSSGEGRVVLDVDDDGPGIPETAREKIFDPFFTTKPVGQGTGLGLWLVYNTATAHGGTVSVGAAESGGARFRIELPAAGRAEIETVAPAIAPKTEPEIFPTVSARILVLDSEAALASLICEALAVEGHHAVAAHDASEALARLAEQPFDVLVSDAELPGLPGDRLAREVERLRPEARGRIVLTTGEWESREPEAVARRLGAGLLRKPFELDELRRIVRTRLARSPES